MTWHPLAIAHIASLLAHDGDVPPCTAQARDFGTGFVLRCALSEHGPEVEHLADGMMWRDGEPPRGMGG